MSKSRINIAIFYRDYCSGGGIPRETELFSRHLSQITNTVHIFYYHNDEKYIGIRNVGNIFYYGYRKPIIPFLINGKLVEDVKKLSINTFFLVGGHIPSNYQISRLCKKLNIKYVLAVGDAYSQFLQKRRWFLKLLYKHAIEKKIIRKASMIRVYSLYNLDEIFRYSGIDSDYFILEEGVDIELLERRVRLKITKSISKPEDDVNLLYFGRIDLYDKGIGEIIEVITKGNFRKNVVLNIVGPVETRHRNNFLEKAKLLELVGKSQNVNYYGVKKGLELFDFVESSDLVICLTRHDGIPRALRESLYLSVPLVVTAETNVGDRVKEYDAGYVVTREESSIRGAIENYIAKDKTQIKLMRKNAYRLANEVYDWEIVAKKFVEIIGSQ